MTQKQKNWIFFTFIVSIVEILCAVGLMNLGAHVYLQGAKLCTMEHSAQTTKQATQPIRVQSEVKHD